MILNNVSGIILTQNIIAGQNIQIMHSINLWRKYVIE
jgi:hypothetical protein